MKMHAACGRARFPRIRIGLGALEWLFLLAGVAALDAYIWINASTIFWQAYADWTFDQNVRGLTPSARGFLRDQINVLLGRERSKPEIVSLPVVPPNAKPLPEPGMPVTKPPAPASVIGRLEIPNLHLAVMVREGADAPTLRRAVGHIPGTALPGKMGNVGLAGHRDTFFRALRNIQRDDTIEFATEYATYRYLVESTQIVGPSDVGVLASSNKQTLTLVTCYPFYYVGSAPKRFIVRAALVSKIADQRPPGAE